MTTVDDVLRTSINNRVRLIQINNLKKKNALPVENFRELADILNDDAKNDDVLVTIVTGTGDYFSSGLYLRSSGDVLSADTIRYCVSTVIKYPKLLIAVVNGPAVGFGTTLLPLFDVVYASDRATFSVPFMKLKFTPDICASYTFPLLMGKSMAFEVLLLGRQLNAAEALRVGLASQVVPQAQINDLIKKLYRYGDLPLSLVKAHKYLNRKHFESKLLEVNELEIAKLMECFENGGFVEAVINFQKRKSKL